MKISLILSLAFTMVASIPIDTSNNGSNQLGEFYITEPIHDGTTYIMGDG